MKKWTKSLTILVVLFLIFGIFIQSVYADKEKLEKIKQAIKEKGAKWDADENSISELPDDQFKMMLGSVFPAGPPKGVKTRPLEYTAVASLDWRNINGANYVTSVKNQGQCGSCWAFGTVAAVESLYMWVNKTPVIKGRKTSVDPIDLSEQDLVSCLYGQLPTPPPDERSGCNGCSGCDPYWAYDYLKTTGVPGESCFPYAASNTSCITTCPVLVQTDGWSALTQDVVSLETAISYQPIPAGFDVFDDFRYYRSGVYQHVTGPWSGRHLICIIGWNNSPAPEGNGKNRVTPPPYFICKNSWGNSWGESGFFRIAQSEISTVVNFGARAADLNMSGETLLAPPRLTKSGVMVTLWGSIKSLY